LSVQILSLTINALEVIANNVDIGSYTRLEMDIKIRLVGQMIYKKSL
jgi:hypothetical protein